MYKSYSNPIFEPFKTYTPTGVYWKKARNPPPLRPPATPAIKTLINQPFDLTPIRPKTSYKEIGANIKEGCTSTQVIRIRKKPHHII